MKHEIDTDLIASLLRNHGHVVGHVIPTPDNGGSFEFEVDGNLLSLAEARNLLEMEDERHEAVQRSNTNDVHASAPPAGPIPTP